MSIHPTNIFEVHFSVSDRKLSTDFYERVLGFTLATHIDRRDITFLWMDGPGSKMIGLWGPKCPDPPMSHGKSHVAFQLSADKIIDAPKKLRELGVSPLDFDKKPTEEAIVLCWMPAISVYFNDPDGNSLEFIDMLNAEARPELGVIPFSEWKK